ncbi:MAG: sensor histidine kinase [Geminicoccaceae bacterium]
MIRAGSVRLRLLAGGAILVVLALAATGVALSALFRRHVVAQFDTELVNQLNSLTAALQRHDDGTVSIRAEPGDPRFHTPYGGRYWQIEAVGKEVLRSRSLWDRDLHLAKDAPAPGELHRHEVQVPGIGELRVMERLVRFSDMPGDAIRVALALLMAEIDSVAARFDELVAITLALLAMGLVAASALQVSIGLAPLARVGRSLASMRSGAATRLEGEFPLEVSALVDELNGLLAQQAHSIERAQAQAGDLAHSLKTSLQLLLIEADRLGGDGRERAPAIREQAAHMQRVIDRHLVRARAQGRLRLAGPGIAVAPSVAALARVLGPVAAKRGTAIEISIAVGHRFAGDRADLEEILGNLLDNACKWADSRVSVTSSFRRGRLCIEVDDDGPGLDEKHRQAVFARGQRLDERMPGSGLGLAIAQELAVAYGGAVSLATSPMGGLAASVELPGADDDFRPTQAA